MPERNGHGGHDMRDDMETDTFPNARLTVVQIAKRLGIGRLAVYAMLERGTLPGIRIGRRWLITRHAYENWERTCGANGRLASLRSQS